MKGNSEALEIPYSTYLVATDSLLTSMGDYTVAHEKNFRENKKVKSRDAGSTRPGQAFEDFVVRPSMYSLQHDDVAFERMIKNANGVLNASNHTLTVDDVKIVLPQRTKNGKKRAARFYDFYFIVTFTDGTRGRNLAVPVNAKWSNAQSAEHACAGRMIQWITGLHRNPLDVKIKKIVDVEKMLAEVIKDVDSIAKGQLTLDVEPQHQEVPTDYHFLVFNKPKEGDKWSTSAHTTSLLSLDPDTGLVWTDSERWPHINIRFHAHRSVGKIFEGENTNFQNTFSARRLGVAMWIANKRYEAFAASPLMKAIGCKVTRNSK